MDEIVEPLCVETRGKHLLAVHFTALATACEILLASADLFTAIELGALAAREARRVRSRSRLRFAVGAPIGSIPHRFWRRRARQSAPEDGSWRVDIGRHGSEKQASLMLDVDGGALVTSGGTRRNLSKDGLQHSANQHPRMVWPTRDGPRSVTVAANSCTKAGLLATLAMLHGARAEEFLEEQGVRHWVLRKSFDLRHGRHHHAALEVCGS